jgi:4'-phosphopantetheinyl transferase
MIKRPDLPGKFECTSPLAKHSLFDLPEGEVHLWFAYPDEWEETGLTASGHAILEAGEIARSERFHSPAHRRLFLTSRLLLRTTLSRYAEIPPVAWRFVTGDHGKPRVAPEAGSPAPAFNLANTAGIAVVALTRRCDVGVDVENMDRRVHARRLIERFFSPEEEAELGKLPSADLCDRFFLTWTLKEAYIKGLGRGLAEPLDSFTFHLTGERPRRIDFSAAHPQDLNKWRFLLVEPLPRSVAALAVACDPATAVTIRCYRAVSPGETTPLTVAPVGLSPGVICPPPGNAASVFGRSCGPTTPLTNGKIYVRVQDILMVDNQ